MDTSQLVELLEDMTREMLALWESEDYSEEAEMQLITKNTDTLAQYFLCEKRNQKNSLHSKLLH